MSSQQSSNFASYTNMALPEVIMYCFNCSVECQDRKLPAVLGWPIVGLITVLKSPPIMISVDSCNVKKNVVKKDGLSELGPYMLNCKIFVVDGCSDYDV